MEMIKVNCVREIWLAYDRYTHETYGTPQPPAAFYMQPVLKEALEEFIGLFDILGWSPDIKTILSGGAYVKKGGPRNAHRLGIAIDIDGFVLSDSKVHSAVDAPDRLYWKCAAALAIVFGVVLHREYDIYHVDHFHVDLSKPVAWRGSRSQITLVQKILNVFANSKLVVDGKLGPLTKSAWMKALGNDDLELGPDFKILLTSCIRDELGE